MKMGDRKSRYVIQSVSRALELLKLFSEEPDLSLTEISQRLSLSTSSVFRLLATLQAHGYLEQNPASRRYRLGVACLELGGTFLSQSDVRRRALPILRSLRDDCRETVHMGMLDGREVVYIEKLESLQPIGSMGSRIGARAPARCTALGKAMLAYRPEDEVRRLYPEPELPQLTPSTITDLEELIKELDRIRERGYAIDEQENELGVKCIAVPIWDHLHNARVAVSVSGPAERISRAIAERGLVLKLIEVGQTISLTEGP
jgi:IclR family KDG regulon transcriptional repressor